MMICLAFGVVLALYFAVQCLYRNAWAYHLSVDASLPEQDVHEGEVAQITETIINDKFLPLPVLETFFALDRSLRYQSVDNAARSDKTYRRDAFAVGMKRKITRSFDITCEKRGYYTLETIEMMSSDLFLQNKFLAKRAVFSSLHVYPRKVRSDQIVLPYQRIMGELLVQKKMYSDPFAFGGMRDYVNTDPMSSINWKASAKAQSLIVNLYDSSNDQKVVILLDTADMDDPDPHSDLLTEESIRIACALAERLLLQGVAVTLLGNAVDICSGELLHLQNLKGQSVALMKQYLARLTLGQETPINAYFSEIPPDTFVVLVSKNQPLEAVIQANLQDYVWVLPYRAKCPELSLCAGQCLPWEYKMRNIG